MCRAATSASGTRDSPCAYCAIVEQISFLDSRGWDHPSTPLFPTEFGGTVTKEAMVSTIEAVAARVGLPIKDAGGYRLWGGHSLRVTGPQWLASQGISVANIQLLARWNSDIVLRYVPEVPLARLTEEYRRAQDSQHLHDLFVAAKRTVSELAADIADMRSRLG